MARAVVDSSTPIHLARIGRVPLLDELFDAVPVPSAVWDEVVVQGDGLPGAKEMRSARQDGWMAVVDIEDPDTVDRAGGALDPGEAEAIALALQEEEDARGRPDALVLDEAAARRAARDRGLPTTGTVGLLLAGYRGGHVDDLEQELEDLRATGFWIGDRLVREILRRA